MGFEQKSEGDVLVVKPLDHRVDARSASEFKEELTHMIQGGHGLIALNMSEIEFIDSSGLGAIVGVLKLLKGHGDMVIVGAQPTVMSLFKLTRLDKVFRMFPGEAEAVAALCN